MYSVLLTIHVLVTVFLIGIILMQRSASDGMGLTSSASTSLLSGKAAASAVTRATAILATLFILTSLGLGIITTRTHATQTSILDRIGNANTPAAAPVTPGTTSAAPTTKAPATQPSTPAEPSKPSVPRPE